jgi:hypothetical protein
MFAKITLAIYSAVNVRPATFLQYFYIRTFDKSTGTYLTLLNLIFFLNNPRVESMFKYTPVRGRYNPAHNLSAMQFI